MPQHPALRRRVVVEILAHIGAGLYRTACDIQRHAGVERGDSVGISSFGDDKFLSVRTIVFVQLQIGARIHRAAADIEHLLIVELRDDRVDAVPNRNILTRFQEVKFLSVRAVLAVQPDIGAVLHAAVLHVNHLAVLFSQDVVGAISGGKNFPFLSVCAVFVVLPDIRTISISATADIDDLAGTLVDDQVIAPVFVVGRHPFDVELLRVGPIGVVKLNVGLALRTAARHVEHLKAVLMRRDDVGAVFDRLDVFRRLRLGHRSSRPLLCGFWRFRSARSLCFFCRLRR